MPLTLTYLGPWPLRAKMSAKIGPRATGASLAAPGGLSVSVMMLMVVVSRTPPVVQEADTYLQRALKCSDRIYYLHSKHPFKMIGNKLNVPK